MTYRSEIRLPVSVIRYYLYLLRSCAEVVFGEGENCGGAAHTEHSRQYWCEQRVPTEVGTRDGCIILIGCPSSDSDTARRTKIKRNQPRVPRVIFLHE